MTYSNSSLIASDERMGATFRTHEADSRDQPKPPSPANLCDIGFLRAMDADNEDLVNKLVHLVNKVYDETESELFKTGHQRTTESEVVQFIRDGLFAVASLPNGANSLETTATELGGRSYAVINSIDEIVGCVYVKTIPPKVGNLGMLALDSTYRGGGLGRHLVSFAEESCRRAGCNMMQLELLVPTTFEHALKVRMQAWYLRMGYQIVSLRDFADDYPMLAPELAGPTDYKIFQKQLQ